MQYHLGTFTRATTGNATIIHGLGVVPVKGTFTISKKNGGVVSDQGCLSIGKTNGTIQKVNILFASDAGCTAREYTSYCLAQLEDTGTVSRVVSAAFVSWTASNIVLNFDAATTDYTITMELEG